MSRKVLSLKLQKSVGVHCADAEGSLDSFGGKGVGGGTLEEERLVV